MRVAAQIGFAGRRAGAIDDDGPIRARIMLPRLNFFSLNMVAVKGPHVTTTGP